MALRRILLPWDSLPREPAELSTAARGPIAVVQPLPGAPRIIARDSAEPFAAATGTGVQLIMGTQGMGVGSASASTDSWRLHSAANQTNTVWERPSGAVSVMVAFTRRGNASGTSPLFGNTSPSISPFAAWGLFDASGTGTLRFECSAGGTNRSITASSGITNHRLTVGIGTYDGTTVRLYQDGVEVASLAASGALVYPNDSVARGPALANFWLYTGQNRSFVGEIYVGALWDVGLTAAEVADYTASAGRVYEPRSILVPVAAGAPGAAVAGATVGSTAAPVAAVQSHAGAVAGAVTPTAATGAAATQVHLGSVSAASVSTAAASPTGSGAGAAAVAAATVGPSASAPAGAQTHAGVVIGATVLPGSTDVAGAQTHAGLVAAAAIATAAGGVAGAGAGSAAAAAATVQPAAASPVGTQLHQATVAGAAIGCEATSPAGSGPGAAAAAGAIVTPTVTTPAGVQIHRGAAADAIVVPRASAIAGGGAAPAIADDLLYSVPGERLGLVVPRELLAYAVPGQALTLRIH